ncbi:hypothetical protein BDZ91DRAFT_52819 [Kalaharituber pfeilii]|nr:hypothetical protein BDZ91DRAFT_52819 [Kalaharituber pfeilii]
MVTTLSIIFLVLSIPFLVQAGRSRNLFGPPPSFARLRRTISAPTVPTQRPRPKAKRRATTGDEPSVTADGVMTAEPEEDEDMMSDTSAESYVRFGRGMTLVDEKIGGGIVRSSVDH